MAKFNKEKIHAITSDFNEVLRKHGVNHHDVVEFALTRRVSLDAEDDDDECNCPPGSRCVLSNQTGRAVCV